MEILKGRGGSRLWNSEGMGGNTFWNFRRQGGLKRGSRPWLGMDIFWNCPLKMQGIPSLGVGHDQIPVTQNVLRWSKSRVV